MRKIFGLGETVFDIIFKDEQPISAKAGGSVLNALVSLARLGHEVNFISELGNDMVGNTILNFLNKNHINTSYIKKYDQGQSALAMAFLNEHNDATYDFYKNYPKERLTGNLPPFNKGDIFLFGSSYAIDINIRQQVSQIVNHAKNSGCIIIYDPNFRSKHGTHLSKYQHYLTENMQMADIVRGSNEDFANIFSTSTANDSYNAIQSNYTNLIYTANKDGVFLNTPTLSQHYTVPTIKPVSTIGAGDNFNAGIIHALLNNNISKEDINTLPINDWNKIIESGIKLSTEVCLSLDNYISPLED